MKTHKTEQQIRKEADKYASSICPGWKDYTHALASRAAGAWNGYIEGYSQALKDLEEKQTEEHTPQCGAV